MLYIESPSNDAYFNMALEEYLFEREDEEFFMLWQNENAVVVGRHQNTVEEINAAYVRERGISVVRRLSGGGAMYQDLGNVNYTFIVNREADGGLDFSLFTEAVVDALRALGAPAEAGGRNDLLIEGRKISGASQFAQRGRTLHHGTLLFDSDLGFLSGALNVPPQKLESKSVKSVASRVVNVRGYLEKDMDVREFIEFLRGYIFERYGLREYALTSADTAEIERLAREKYSEWEWNYGESPPYSLRRERRFASGTVSVRISVGEGSIESLQIYGDFFARLDMDTLCAALTGLPLRREKIKAALDVAAPESCIHGVSNAELAELIAE